VVPKNIWVAAGSMSNGVSWNRVAKVADRGYAVAEERQAVAIMSFVRLIFLSS